MNTLLRCTRSGLFSSSPISSPLIGRVTGGGLLSVSKRFASYSANQGKSKVKEPKQKRGVSPAYLKFNRRPQGKFPEFRPALELLTDYLPNDATIRLAVARIHMANRKPLYKAELNREINAILTIPDRKVQFMGDLRRVPENQITDLSLPDWLKTGLIGLAKATPKPTSENPQ